MNALTLLCYKQQEDRTQRRGVAACAWALIEFGSELHAGSAQAAVIKHTNLPKFT